MDSAVIQRVLLDTGPLVALLRADDFFHENCSKHLPLMAPLLFLLKRLGF
jgi:hypothetical protein